MKAEGYDTAVKRAEAHKSERYAAIETLERFVDTTQYDHIAHNFFEADVPIWERRPVLVFPLVEQAIGSNVDLVLGESRFPTVKTGADDEVLGETLEDLGFHALCREALEMAQGTRSVAALFSVNDDGEIEGATIKSKWCTPTFAGKRVTRLEIQYPFIDTEGDGRRKKAVAKIYRRVIDETNDTTYVPVELTDDADQEIEWKVDETVEHGFGFCPVVWYPFLKPCTVHNVFDGVAIHEKLTDEIHQHDLARSQWHRMGLYSEPQPYETGVPHGYNPTLSGDAAVREVIPATTAGGAVGPDNPQTSGYAVPSKPGARRKGPGFTWQYTSPETKVGYLLIPADALEAMARNVYDIRTRLQEGLAVVFLDPENLKFSSQTSGKTLERLLQRQINRCGKIRLDFSKNFMRPAIQMIAAIARVKGIADLGDVTKVSFKWGPWFPAEFTDIQAYVTALVAAVKGGITTTEMGTRLLASQLGLDDVDELIAAVKAEAAERQEQAQENARLSADIGQGTGADRGRGDKPGTDERGGSGGGNSGGGNARGPKGKR